MSRTKRAVYIGGHSVIRRQRTGYDRKPWFKPPHWYKAIKERIRRAKNRMAIATGREPERWRKTNVWDWT